MTGKIKLNAASGGGSVSFQAPSSTGDDRVITLPTTADGTVLTTTNPKAGNIIQVVQSVKVDTASFETTSFSDISGLSASITPSSSSNKILVETSLYLASAGSITNKINFVRGSTNIGQPTGSSVSHQATMMQFIVGVQMNPFTMIFLDSPSTTSATTYKLQIAQDGTGIPVYINRYHGSDNYHGISTLTLMEVAG